MPRPPRLVVPGLPLHITQRGNNRVAIFRDAADYLWLRAAMRSAAHRAACAVHAYVLMPNHFHILMTPSHAQGAALMMQRIGREYVRHFNDRHGRTGTLWEGRFHSFIVEDDEYFFRCSRYIEMNPSRARLVVDPVEYRWSSYRGNTRGVLDRTLTPHALYAGLHGTRDGRAAAYRAMFDAIPDRHFMAAMRASCRTGRSLGSQEFTRRMDALRRGPRRTTHGGDRKSAAFLLRAHAAAAPPAGQASQHFLA